jgi:hypothetical protein
VANACSTYAESTSTARPGRRRASTAATISSSVWVRGIRTSTMVTSGSCSATAARNDPGVSVVATTSSDSARSSSANPSAALVEAVVVVRVQHAPAVMGKSPPVPGRSSVVLSSSFRAARPAARRQVADIRPRGSP